MKMLEERVLKDGKALDCDVLLVDSFLNHQIDMALMVEIGHAFVEAFREMPIDRVLTIEASGIAPAGQVALLLGVPLVVAKKRASRISGSDLLQTPVHSFTKNETYQLTCKHAYLPEGENVLFIDDFLAMGEAALGAKTLCDQANATLCGIGIVIEKAFQPGRAKLESMGIPITSLARVASMQAGKVAFCK